MIAQNIAHYQCWRRQGIYLSAFRDFAGGTMNRERALKILLVLVGLFFSAGVLSFGDFPLATETAGRFADDA
jgi:hypothetical protein